MKTRTRSSRILMSCMALAVLSVAAASQTTASFKQTDKACGPEIRLNSDWPSLNLYGRPVLGGKFLYGLDMRPLVKEQAFAMLITYIGFSKFGPMDLGVFPPVMINHDLHRFPKNAGCFWRVLPFPGIVMLGSVHSNEISQVLIKIPRDPRLSGIKFYTQSLGFWARAYGPAFVSAVGEGIIGVN